MRHRTILHTSDWHLGQRLYDYGRTWEHACFLEWLLDAIEQHEVDAVLISGDLFDTAHPSSTAQRQWFEFLSAALERRPHCDIVAIGGNHDSSARLDASEPVTRRIGVTVLGGASTADGEFDPSRLVVPLGARAPGGTWGWAAAIPFLRPEDLGTLSDLQAEDALVTLTRRRHEAVFKHLASVAQPGQARLALGHGVILGSERSPSSERDVMIGTAVGVPVDVFPEELAYVALGHLHRPQRAGKRDNVRYSGSPLPLHVSEADYPHQVVLSTLQDGKLAKSEQLLLPKWVPIVRIPGGGKAAAPEVVLEQLGALPSHADKPESQQPFLAVKFKPNKPEPDFGDRVGRVIKDKGYRLTIVEAETSDETASADPLQVQVRLNQLDPKDVFLRLYRFKHGDQEPAPELVAAFEDLLHRTTMQQEAKT